MAGKKCEIVYVAKTQKNGSLFYSFVWIEMMRCKKRDKNNIKNENAFGLIEMFQKTNPTKPTMRLGMWCERSEDHCQWLN